MQRNLIVKEMYIECGSERHLNEESVISFHSMFRVWRVVRKSWGLRWLTLRWAIIGHGRRLVLSCSLSATTSVYQIYPTYLLLVCFSVMIDVLIDFCVMSTRLWCFVVRESRLLYIYIFAMLLFLQSFIIYLFIYSFIVAYGPIFKQIYLTNTSNSGLGCLYFTLREYPLEWYTSDYFLSSFR